MKFEIESLKDYTVIPNEYLRDKALTLKGKGLLTIMYSLPNQWDYTINGLCKITNTGITAIRKAIEELECLGYLERKQTRDNKGRIDYIYIVHLRKCNKIIKNIQKSISYKRLKEAYNRI